MIKARRENYRMKIPALLHLSRLGYVYLSREKIQQRDRKGNFLPNVLLTAVERINNTHITEEDLKKLIDDLLNQLDSEDLGKQFYMTIRNGWKGLRLIDFWHPENNLFHCATELSCGRGAGSFRPDITLFVNGLPLAMIEVKTEDHTRGLQAEYNRMLKRFQSKEALRYLQCVQLWAFSDDHTDDLYWPMSRYGAFFAAPAANDFPVYIAREKHLKIYTRLLPRDTEAEQEILEDNGILVRPHTRDFQRDVSPRKATHRMFTTLFLPERFLFLLRYGIQYIQTTDHFNKVIITRRILTTEQLFALSTLVSKAKRGYLNQTVSFGGAAGEAATNASMIALLRDLEPAAKIYWISAEESELQRDAASLQSSGIRCIRSEDKAMNDQLIMITADRNSATCLTKTEISDSDERKVYILSQTASQYGQKADFSDRLRKCAPKAVIIKRLTNRMPESSFSPCFSVCTDRCLYYITVASQNIR